MAVGCDHDSGRKALLRLDARAEACADMSALRSFGTLIRQAGQAFESFGAYLQGSGPELGPSMGR